MNIKRAGCASDLHSTPPSRAKNYPTAARALSLTVTALDGLTQFVMQYGARACA
jgi:hypothetical protein